MGIKGIYAEIGQGQRVALTKLAVENYEKTGRPLRIAVDISIWQFQTQSGKGGSNPALRTLYYRFLRLLSMNIQPLFVFDGSQKPPFKRNKRTVNAAPSLTDSNTKNLLRLFGFPFHIAPGEAEAECALLQREGLVDAVLSEDVDTLMFGCSKTLRKWSNEESRGHRVPTHVTLYDTMNTDEGISGLNREGMILVALMSGGDYITEGIPGCGIKVACEAARAGYGKSLCKLSKADTIGLDEWRKNLIHELQNNESKFFRVKHKSLQIPETFPNREVLGYYTHPVVSSAAKLVELRKEIRWDQELDVMGLRLFVAESFGWTYKTGAKKFIRGLAPALLASKVRSRANRRRSVPDNSIYTTTNEKELVHEISGRRQHFSTDGVPELNLVYIPEKIVGLDLNVENDESEDTGRDGLAPIDEYQTLQGSDFESGSENDSRIRSKSSKRKVTTYDPTQLQRAWVPETIAKFGIPLMVEDYEEAQRNRPKVNKPKLNLKKASKKVVIDGGMPKGALDRFINTTKPAIEVQSNQSSKRLHSTPQIVPQAHLTPQLTEDFISYPTGPSNVSPPENRVDSSIMSRRRGRPEPVTTKSKSAANAQKKQLTYGNPWTIAHSSSPVNQVSPCLTVSISKPGIVYEKRTTNQQTEFLEEPPGLRLGLSRSPPLSPPPLGKHSRPISSSSDRDLSLNSSKGSQLVSPTKKRVPTAYVGAVRPAAASELGMADTQHIINISSSPIVASISVLASEKIGYSSGTKTIVKSLQGNPAVQPKAKSTKFLIARESLEGTWKTVDQEPARGTAWRLSGIDVLDMTDD